MPLVQVLAAVLSALAPVLPFLVKSFLAIYAAVKLWTAVQASSTLSCWPTPSA